MILNTKRICNGVRVVYCLLSVLLVSYLLRIAFFSVSCIFSGVTTATISHCVLQCKKFLLFHTLLLELPLFLRMKLKRRNERRYVSRQYSIFGGVPLKGGSVCLN